MSNYDTIKAAATLYTAREIMSAESIEQRISALGDSALFSLRQLQKISGLPYRTIAGLIDKGDRTGGRFDPECLPILLEILHARHRGEIDLRLYRQAVDTGTSAHTIARLLGMPRRTVSGYVAKAKDLGL